MGYKDLKKLWYQDKEIYNMEYNFRFNGISAIKFPICIHNSPSFIVVTPEIALLVEKIFSLNTKIVILSKEFPQIAMNMFINQFLVDEIKKTNDIEGVHSTRKEIEIVVKAKESNQEVTKNRLFGLVSKYKALVSGQSVNIPLMNSMDLRNLYDALVLPEIEKKDIPDGEIFRKESVGVCDLSGKEVHRGLNPESSIIQAVEQLLEIIRNDSIGGLIKASVIQYFIGYIHPFYDGNGRLGRFLSSYIMSEILHPLVSIRLSYTIKSHLSGQEGYYNAFERCNHPKNKGDITPFIIYILNMILLSEKNIHEILQDRFDRYKYYFKKLTEILAPIKDTTKQSIYLSICSILVQNVLFTPEYLDYKTLSENLSDTIYIVKTRVKELCELGIPILFDRSGNKDIFKLDIARLETED